METTDTTAKKKVARSAKKIVKAVAARGKPKPGVKSLPVVFKGGTFVLKDSSGKNHSFELKVQAKKK